MQKTISAMVGKGSVNHNSRKFKAENVNAAVPISVQITAMRALRKFIMNCLTKHLKDTTLNRQDQTERQK